MKVVALLMFFHFLFAGDAFALSLSFDSAPTEIKDDDEFEVNVSFSCPSCKDSYLRAVFYKEGTTSYFGYTQNEKGDWINTTTDKTLFYHLSPESLEEGSWSGKIKARPDPDSSYNDGAGNYLFKVGRYTSASSSATWSSNTASIFLIVPTPTPTVANAATPTSTPTSSPTVKPATPTASPTPTKTPTPTTSITKPTLTSSPTDVKRSDLLTPTVSIASEILGTNVSATPSQEVVTSLVETLTVEKNSRQTDTLSAIIVGIVSIGLLGVVFYRLSKIPIRRRVK